MMLNLPREMLFGLQRAWFFVDGIPGPKGSMRAMLTKDGRAVAIPAYSERAKAWEKAVHGHATLEARRIGWVAPGAVAVTAIHYFQRPAHHVRKNGALRGDAPLNHQQDPDADKILRATMDGLTGPFFPDDNVVVVATSQKRWGDAETLRLLGEGIEVQPRYGALLELQEIPETIERLLVRQGVQRDLLDGG